jgi:hypothetical protein
MEQENFAKVDLQVLVEKLESQKIRKRDLIVPSTAISMREGRLSLMNNHSDDELADLLKESGISSSGESHNEIFDLTDSCHAQISDKLGIPGRYYEKMRTEAVEMLDYNVSEWLGRKPSNYFLRTFTSNNGSNGIARAFLSDRFKVIDHLDILITALDAIKSSDRNVIIESADLTEQRMYVRFIAPDIVKSAPELLKNYNVPNGNNNDGGFGVCTGFVLSNSETGHATFTIAPRLTVLACQNGMILHKDKIAEKHLGTKMDVGTFDWSESTRQKELELIQCQVQDAVSAYLSEDYIGRVLDEMTMKGSKLLEHPVDAVNNISVSLGFSEERKSELLNYFMLGKDTTGFGAVQSLTYLAQNVQPDLRYELETASVNILDNIEKFDRPAVKSYNQLKMN